MKSLLVISAACIAVIGAAGAFTVYQNGTARAEDSSELLRKADEFRREGNLEMADEFIIEAAKKMETNGRAWFQAGLVYHYDKEFREARECFEKSLNLGYSPTLSYYNIGCGYALLNEHDKALTFLEKAVAAGFRDRGQLTSDHDLKTLRSLPRYVKLVDSLTNPLEGNHKAQMIDMLVGSWDVFEMPGNRWSGGMDFQRMLDGYGIEYHWTNYSGSHTSGMFLFDSSTGAWNQLLGTEKGAFISRSSVESEDQLIFEGTRRMPDGLVFNEKITWVAQEDGSILQELESHSSDSSSPVKTRTVKLVPQAHGQFGELTITIEGLED
jgi:tetratricopeptide (TPR) repeat protein